MSGVSRAMVWVHEDALRQDHPVFAAAGRDAECVFVWDDAYFQSQNYSLKRLVFIYECLMDLNVTLYQGEASDVLSQISVDFRIYTARSHNPYIRDTLRALPHDVDIRVIEETPLTEIAANADMGRFFRYWNRARKSALSINGASGG